MELPAANFDLPPAGELPLRWQRLQGLMAKANLGGMLVYADQIKPDPIYYVAQYTLLGERAFCYLPPEGQPVLFISEAWDLERAQAESGLRVYALSDKWAKEVADAAKGCEGAVGLAGREAVSAGELQALEDALGRKTVTATPLIDRAAMVKSPYELDLIRRAAQMADAGFTRAMDVARIGMKDYELGAEIEYAMRLMGATDNYQMLVVGKDNTGMLLPCGKTIERGDILLFEITPANHSVTYTAQLCRTAFAGEPSDLLLKKYEILVEALEESLKVIRPGVNVGEVARIQNEIIGAAGYAKYCQPPYMRARGHGFGLGRIELEEGSDLVFEEGMNLVIHPNQFIPETGYLALGELILVTRDGVERLTRMEPKIYQCKEAAK